MAPIAAAPTGGAIRVGGFVALGMWALVQFVVAKARIELAPSSATRVEDPLYNFRKYPFVLVPVYIII